MTTTLLMNINDLDALNKIVKENNLTSFKLIQTGSGIGYCTNIEYETYINERIAIVSMTIADESNW